MLSQSNYASIVFGMPSPYVGTRLQSTGVCETPMEDGGWLGLGSGAATTVLRQTKGRGFTPTSGSSIGYLRKMLLGHSAWTPMLPSTSCVISTSTATLVSMYASSRF